MDGPIRIKLYTVDVYDLSVCMEKIILVQTMSKKTNFSTGPVISFSDLTHSSI